jgi:hypothetical protein
MELPECMLVDARRAEAIKMATKRKYTAAHRRDLARKRAAYWRDYPEAHENQSRKMIAAWARRKAALAAIKSQAEVQQI